MVFLLNNVIKWLNFYNEDISNKNINIKIDIPEDMVIVTDEDFFDHVLNNLISNAIK